jgi:hypothetical protein
MVYLIGYKFSAHEKSRNLRLDPDIDVFGMIEFVERQFGSGNPLFDL